MLLHGSSKEGKHHTRKKDIKPATGLLLKSLNIERKRLKGQEKVKDIENERKNKSLQDCLKLETTQ